MGQRGTREARESALVQVLCWNVWYWRCIFRKSDRYVHQSRRTIAPETARKQFDCSCQTVVFDIAANPARQWARLAARLAVVSESSRWDTPIDGICGWGRLVRSRVPESTAVSLVAAAVRATQSTLAKHISLGRRSGVSRACAIMLIG